MVNSTGTLKEALINDAHLLISNTELVNRDKPEQILNKLENSIPYIDFKVLAYPESIGLIKRIEELKPKVFGENGTYNTDRKTEITEFKKLERKLRGFRITKPIYLIICIEQLLRLAKNNKWALCKKHGFIYLFNGAFWEELDKELFQFFLGNVALKMGVDKYTGKIHTFKDELFKQFLSEAYLPTLGDDTDKILINLQNGTFEINGKHKKLRDFKQNDFITYQLPFEYRPDSQCPLFMKFLNEVIPDYGKQKVLAEFIGYLFIKTEVLKLEKILILYGSGANGKSVLFEIVNALLGIQNVSNYSLQSLTDETGYYRAKIANKLVNYASEINGNLESSLVKLMGSGEPVQARLPYEQPFILRNYAKLIFNCNELPRDVEHTNAFFRRFLIIHFDVTIPEDKQDKELSRKIIDNELSGIFNWVLDGLDRLMDNKNFSKCEAIENARSEYQKQSDSVKVFIDESGYRVCSDEYIPIKDIYPLYRAFCIEDGYKPVNKSNFMRRLTHHKIYVKRIDIGNVAFLKKD